MPLSFNHCSIASKYLAWLLLPLLWWQSTLKADALNPLEYDARLCTAGIVVLRADISNLLSGALGDSESDWFRQRLAGLGGSIAWLCKRYAAAHGLNDATIRADIHSLQRSIRGGRWVAALDAAVRLGKMMPLQIDGMEPENASTRAIEEGESIYRRYCIGCHIGSFPQHLPPVYSLSSMAQRQAKTEFIARMLTGIHGTPEIGLKNPLSVNDIAGIYAFLLQTESAGNVKAPND